MEYFFNGIFDTNFIRYDNLYEKTNKDIDSIKNKILHINNITISSFSNKKIKQRNLLFSNSNLYIFNKNNNKVKYKISLYFCKMSVKNSNNKNIIYLSKKSVVFIMEFDDNNKDYEIIKNILIPRTIQTDFHLKYDTKKIIGKGGNARVYLCTNKYDNNDYAVKAFVKENIAKMNNGKVY